VSEHQQFQEATAEEEGDNCTEGFSLVFVYGPLAVFTQ
jgi:hypothetical protein